MIRFLFWHPDTQSITLYYYRLLYTLALYSNMSTQSFAFASWFIMQNKLLFNSDIESVIALLNDQTWSAFLASDIALQHNIQIVSNIMPQLVEKKTRKPVAVKKTAASTKKTVASQTSTEINSDILEKDDPTETADKKQKKMKKNKDDTSTLNNCLEEPVATKSKKPKKIPKSEPLEQSIEETIEEPVATKSKKPKKIPKSEPLEQSIEEPSETSPQNIQEEPVVTKSKKPKKIPKSEPLEQSIQETSETSPQNIQEEPVATKSKKPKKIPKSEPLEQSIEETSEEPIVAKKSKKTKDATLDLALSADKDELHFTNIIMENVGDDILNAPADKKQKKPKKNTPEPVEIIVPDLDSVDHTLNDEPYEQTLLTEIFVNDVLFYIDSDKNWYDVDAKPCDKPNDLQ